MRQLSGQIKSSLKFLFAIDEPELYAVESLRFVLVGYGFELLLTGVGVSPRITYT